MGTKIHGKDTDIKVNSTALEADGNSVTLDLGVDVADVTSFGEDYKTYEEGAGNWSITAELFYVESANEQTLFELISGGKKLVEFFPAGSSAGKVYYYGSAILTAFSPTAPVGGAIGLSVTLQGSGTLTRDTVSA